MFSSLPTTPSRRFRQMKARDVGRAEPSGLMPERLTGAALPGARGAAVFGLMALAFCHFGAFTSPAAEVAAKNRDRKIEEAFDSRVVRLDNPSQEVTWSYTNHWDFPLLIERFDEPCTCLRGKAAAEAVEPGKSGSIRAVFNAGPYRGLVRKSLHVRFVGHEKPVELIAEARIPTSVTLSARDLVWPKGDAGTARRVDLKAGTEADFRITALRGLSSDEFTVHTETLAEGRHYRLIVTPGPSAPAAATRCLQIRTDSPDPRDRVLALFIRTGAASAPDDSSGNQPGPGESATSNPATGP